ncbi:MAG TPA: hypothetical protein VME47_15785 [Acetobacteraceae bacterium]|nr:hypothetical protein [Acetobacteraceae bacterium]
MPAELLQDVIFGIGSGDENYLGSGWSPAEDGFRWMIGTESDLWLSNPGPGDAFVLQLELAPFCHQPEVPSQQIAVVVRGQPVGRSVLAANSSVAYRIPGELVSGKAPLRIVFQHPDAARPTDHGHPSDARQLALSIRNLRLLRVTGELAAFRLEGGRGVTPAEVAAETGMPAAQFLMQFESLGDNCEFGLVQRRCGAEPLSLLRFSNIGLRDLTRALETKFEGLGESDTLHYRTDDSPRREYVLRDSRYSLTFHTFLYYGDVDESRLLQQQAARLKLLRRKLLEDLADGEKIFVFKRNDPPRDEEILALYAALSRHGSNTLLWVVPADEQHRAGAMERLLPGLLKGYIDRLAPNENAHDLSFDLWLRLCLQARRIVPAQRIAA